MRYLPLTDNDRQEMLATIGVPDVEALYKDVAKDVLLDAPVDLPTFKGELEVEQIVGGLAAKKSRGRGRAVFFSALVIIAITFQLRPIISFNAANF